MGHPPSFCVAGVVLMGLGLVWWRAWVRLAAPDARALLRGRRGTWQHRPAFCVAGVVLVGLGWVWWRAWVRLVAHDAAVLLRGRRGTWRQHCHTPFFTHIFVTHHLSHTTSLITHNSSHTAFELIDHPPPPLSILPSPSRWNFLEEVDLWLYPVLYFF